jgi:DNA polymerase-3 subunit alpha
MRMLNRLGDIDLSDAYTCIKAISKKTLQTIAKYQEEFVDGAMAKGLARQEALNLFGLIEKFAGYGFNKSHSTAYALIAYQTAFLKAHYPVEFMAALLTGDIPGRNFKSKDALVEHLEDCRRMSIHLVPPDVNRSDVVFKVEVCENGEQKIHFALSAIKGCGGGAADVIVNERAERGSYKSLFDFCERIDSRSVNRSTIETLIRAGAFDSLGIHRSQLSVIVERAIQSGAAVMEDRRRGQGSLFEDFNDPEADNDEMVNLPDIPEWSDRERLAGEKEVLGYYLCSHPLEEYKNVLTEYCTHTTDELVGAERRAEVIVGGMLSAIRFSHTKSPRRGQTDTKYAMFDLEGLQGAVRCILWPEAFVACGHMVEPDAILVVRGTVDRRPGSDETNLIVSDLIPLSEMPKRYTSCMRIRVNESQHGTEQLEKLYEILRHYPGNCTLELTLCLQNGMQVRCACAQMGVENNPEMKSRVNDLLGPNNLKPVVSIPGSSQATGRRRQQLAGSV